MAAGGRVQLGQDLDGLVRQLDRRQVKAEQTTELVGPAFLINAAPSSQDCGAYLQEALIATIWRWQTARVIPI